LTQVYSADEPLLIITNSVNNLHPEVYSFDWLKEVPEGKNVTILADDSHGIGISGPGGCGLHARIQDSGNVKILTVASMAKALGLDAGYILGPSELVGELKSSPVFVGASPPSPGMVYAWLHGKAIYEKAYSALVYNMQFFEK